MAVDATTVVTTSNDDAARLARLYAAKAKAELKRADEAFGAPVRIGGAGQMLASVVLVKGSPDAAERASRRALTGPVGEAAGKALEALGFEAGDWWAVVSRPSDAPASGRARRLELIVEAGQPVIVRGRTLGAIGGLAASLADPAAKALVWSRFKTVARAFAGVVTRP
jgi:hypothetical protein